MGATLGEPDGDRLADTAAGACDENPAAIKVKGIRVLCHRH
jgi:hypothetical protein